MMKELEPNELSTELLNDENLPHSLRRSVRLIKDEEDGNNYTADEILDTIQEDILFGMRSTLSAAYKSGEYKYVCPFCNQPLGLKVRTNEGESFPFFSHYQDSDDYCPVKTTIEIDPDPTQFIVEIENRFKESFLHQDMIAKLKEILNISKSFNEIEQDKVINTPQVTGYRRPSLYSVYKNKDVICFDALVSNPLIGMLVGRNAFYKMQKMFYLWVFPEFSTRFQRLSEKDILYMNRRNVFVFDSSDYYINKNINTRYLSDEKKTDGYKYAYEESVRQKRLMLNCYWQTPVVDDNGEVKIGWKGPELVAFDDLVLDFDSYEVYYHDSDEDFYRSYSSEKQMILNDWMRVKEDRWKKIFDGIEKRKIEYEQSLARQERRRMLAYYYPLIESGDVVPIAFQDEKTKLWGYKLNDCDIISPVYYDVKPFNFGFAWVKKSSYWGMIDYKGNRVLNFAYKTIVQMSDSLFKGARKDYWELIDYNGNKLGDFKEIENFKDGKAKANKNWRCGFINEKGETVIPFEYDTSEDFVDGRAKAEKNRQWGFINEKGETVIPFEYDAIEDFVNGRAKANKNWRWGFINEKGEEIFDHRTLSNGLVVYSSSFMEKCGLMTNSGERITELEFDAIEDFEEGRAKAKKNGKWGVINEKGESLIPFNYDKILCSEGIYKLIVTIGYGWRQRDKIVKAVNLANPSKKIDLSKIEAGKKYTAKITGFHKIGMFIYLPYIGSALVPVGQLKRIGKTINDYEKGEQVIVQLFLIDEKKQPATFKIVNP